MSGQDPSQLVTQKDLHEFRESMEKVVRQMLNENQSRVRFYTPRKFSELTGVPYSTVVSHCKKGLIKASQERPSSSWLIDGSELESYQW